MINLSKEQKKALAERFGGRDITPPDTGALFAVKNSYGFEAHFYTEGDFLLGLIHQAEELGYDEFAWRKLDNGNLRVIIWKRGQPETFGAGGIDHVESFLLCFLLLPVKPS